MKKYPIDAFFRGVYTSDTSIISLMVVDNPKQREKTLLYLALGLAWQLGYTIVTPLLLFGLGGRLLDNHFGTTPVLFLAGLVLAVIATTIWLVVKLSAFTADLGNVSKDPSTTLRSAQDDSLSGVVGDDSTRV